MAKKPTTTFTFLADERIWLPFLLLKRRPGGDSFRIGRFCEAALREALPAEGAEHRLGAIWENDVTMKARAFRCGAEMRALLVRWQSELGTPRGLLIVTAIRRKQERDGLVPGPLRRAAG